MNPVVHFEIPYRVGIRASQFYELTFGWKIQELGPDMGNYILVTTAEEDVVPGAPSGAINGGLYPFDPEWPAKYPSIVIGVDNINQSMEKIRKNGGEIFGEPMKIPGYGTYVSFKDTEGNRLSLMQPKME